MALAIIFDSIGVGEWLVLLAVVLVVVGPKRLPATARTIGRHYAKFRRAADSFKRQLMEMDTEINRAVEDAEREVESAVGVDDFADDGVGDPSFADYDPSAGGDSGLSADGGADSSHADDMDHSADHMDRSMGEEKDNSVDNEETSRRGPYGD